MCGFIAIVGSKSFNPLSGAKLAQAACDRMARRGPDGAGTWQEPGIILSHRRLAILDLNERATQPMHSACGRYVIAYNGEIYNFRALRDELESQGVVFRTNSDTEVLLESFVRYGKDFLPRLQGMFAFIIWDRINRRGFAARDPYGIKPLYIGTTDAAIVVGSQVKALLATGLISRDTDPRGQAGFWFLGSIPEPFTWYKDIRSLKPGHFAWVKDGKVVSQQCWYDIADAWRTPSPAQVSPDRIEEVVRLALKDSIARHMVSDVPVGVFLSGGIDSGTIAGLMVEAGAQNLQGITIAYDEFSGQHTDEAPVAARIAKHYGIRHHIRKVTRDEFLSDLPHILRVMDQPSIDGINTWYASKAVAELGLKVVVSGVGGDELFFGYKSHRQLPALVRRWCLLRRIPGMPALARWGSNLQARRTGNLRWIHAPDWLLTMSGAWWLRRSLFSPQELPEVMAEDFRRYILDEFDATNWVSLMTGQQSDDLNLALGQIESMTYLRNQLLRDSDWASMDHSIELRTPLVDAHLLKILKPYIPYFPHFRGKALLANAPKRALPTEILNRPKTGFGIPIDRWIGDYKVNGRAETGMKAWARLVAASYNEAA